MKIDLYFHVRTKKCRRASVVEDRKIPVTRIPIFYSNVLRPTNKQKHFINHHTSLNIYKYILSTFQNIPTAHALILLHLKVCTSLSKKKERRRDTDAKIVHNAKIYKQTSGWQLRSHIPSPTQRPTSYSAVHHRTINPVIYNKEVKSM